MRKNFKQVINTESMKKREKRLANKRKLSKQVINNE